MSWLFGSGSASASSGTQQFDELLNTCTSELLPTPATEEGALDSEFESALQLSDLIRSAQVKPGEAVKAFRRRLASPNPNVQLRALITLDTAIKNSGDAFLVDVAGTAAQSGTNCGPVSGTIRLNLPEQLEDLATSSNNYKVRDLVLRLVQTWATAFSTKPTLSLSNMGILYQKLKSHPNMPPVSKAAASAMIDSMSAPSWSANEDSDRCERCRDPFTLTNRRHHCRNCGQLFDQKCSSHSIPLPHFGITQPVRVCDGCNRKIASGTPAPFPRPEPPKKLQPRDATYHSISKEDEDLQLALRLSMDSAPKSESFGSGYTPAYAGPGNQNRQVTTDVVQSAEEEDEDLKRAIEASLRDMQLSSPAQPTASQPQAPYQPQSHYQPAAASNHLPPLPSTDLNDTDLTSLLTFAQSVLTPNPTVVPTVHDLQPPYERAEQSRTALVRNLRETVGREQALVGARDKLKDIMRLYEARLERQLQRSAGANPYAQPQQQQPQQYYAPPPSMYPSVQVPQGPQAVASPQPPYVAATPVHPQHNLAQSHYAPAPEASTSHYMAPPQVASPSQPSPQAAQGQASVPQMSPSAPESFAPAFAQQLPQSRNPYAEQPQPQTLEPSAPSAPDLSPSAPPLTSSPPPASAPMQSPPMQQQLSNSSAFESHQQQQQQQQQNYQATPQHTYSAPPQRAQSFEAQQYSQPPLAQETYAASPQSSQRPASAYYQQPPPQAAAAPVQTYQQLATLPSAPQQQPFAPQQFPSVPQSSFAAQMSPHPERQPAKEPASLIDL